MEIHTREGSQNAGGINQRWYSELHMGCAIKVFLLRHTPRSSSTKDVWVEGCYHPAPSLQQQLKTLPVYLCNNWRPYLCIFVAFSLCASVGPFVWRFTKSSCVFPTYSTSIPICFMHQANHAIISIANIQIPPRVRFYLFRKTQLYLIPLNSILYPPSPEVLILCFTHNWSATPEIYNPESWLQYEFQTVINYIYF